MDIDTVEPGVDFRTVIREAVGSSDVLVVLIGRQWVSIVDSSGRRRLDNAADFVRLEIEAALDRDIRVVPVLVQGTEMPREEELPHSLSEFAHRNAIELSDLRWGYDVGRLATWLKKLEREKTERERKEREEAAERAERFGRSETVLNQPDSSSAPPAPAPASRRTPALPASQDKPQPTTNRVWRVEPHSAFGSWCPRITRLAPPVVMNRKASPEAFPRYCGRCRRRTSNRPQASSPIERLRGKHSTLKGEAHG